MGDPPARTVLAREALRAARAARSEPEFFALLGVPVTTDPSAPLWRPVS